MKSDPMLDAIKEILCKAKSYSDEPLMNKLKSKTVIAVEDPEEDKEHEELEAIGSNAEGEKDEDKEKLKAALAKLFS